MGTHARVALHATDGLDGAVGDREIDFARGPARRLRREPRVGEQRFGYAVVPLVLDETAPTRRRQSRFTGTTGDQSEGLQGEHVRKRGRRAHPQRRRHGLQWGTVLGRLPAGDRLEGIDLSTCQTLERFHDSNTLRRDIRGSLIIRGCRIRRGFAATRVGRDRRGAASDRSPVADRRRALARAVGWSGGARRLRVMALVRRGYVPRIVTPAVTAGAAPIGSVQGA